MKNALALIRLLAPLVDARHRGGLVFRARKA